MYKSAAIGIFGGFQYVSTFSIFDCGLLKYPLLDQPLGQFEPSQAWLTLNLVTGAIDARVIQGMPDSVCSGLVIRFAIEPTLTGDQIARLLDLYLEDFQRVLNTSSVVSIAHGRFGRLTPAGHDLAFRLSKCVERTSKSWTRDYQSLA